MRRVLTFFMCVFAVIALASVAAAAVGDWVIITVPLAPTFGYTNATRTDEDDEMMYGMVGEIIDTGISSVPGANMGNMYLINTQYNYNGGYLRSDAGEYETVSKNEAIAWRDAQTHWVISNFVDVLPEANLKSYPPLITLPKGSLLKVTNESDPLWYTVTLHDNRTGYVRKNTLRKKPDLIARPSDPFDTTTLTEAQKTAIQNQIASDAIAYTNSNYRWAGKTPLGLDCSGLSSMAYMLNGIDTYRNSRIEPGSNTPILGEGISRAVVGFPLALKHIDTPANTAMTFDPNSTHTLASLSKAKPGDSIYWSGHQGVYTGNGEYVHANGSSASNRLNSLIPDMDEPAPTRTDLNTYSDIMVWGTPFPDEPEKIIVGRLSLTNTTGRTYRIIARIDGYVPNRAEFYPCGVNSGGEPLGYDGTTEAPVVHPITSGANIRYMLFDSVNTTSASAPTFTYGDAAVGNTYSPAIKFFNETGYRPKGNTIVSDVYIYPGSLVFE